MTFSVVDAPSRNALDVTNDGSDDPALLEGLWGGAATADVVVVVVRDFRTGDVTHTSETIDAARDLRWIGEVAKRRDVVVLEKRIKELEKLRAGNWLRGEKEALQYRQAARERAGPAQARLRRRPVVVRRGRAAALRP